MNKSKLSILILFTLQLLFLPAQTSWQNIGPGAGSDLKSIAIHPNNPNIVYIGGDIEGIFKTTNGGESWQNINNNLSTEYGTPDVYWVQEIVFDPHDSSYNTLFICTVIGIFKTVDAGKSWEMVYPEKYYTEEDFIPISYLTFDPQIPDKIFAGTGTSYTSEDGNGTIIISEDLGNSWTVVNLPASDAGIHGIYIDPLSSPSNRTIYLSTNRGFYLSENNGNDWSSFNDGLPHQELRRLNGVVLNDHTTLFMTVATTSAGGTESDFNGGIYKLESQDIGWENINSNLPKFQTEESLFYYYWKFSINPIDPDNIIIGTTRGWPDEGLSAYTDWGIYETTDGGNEWERISGNVDYGWLGPPFFIEEYAFILEFAPSDPNIIYWGLDSMIKSENSGDSWNEIYTNQINGFWKGNGLELMAVDGMAVNPDNPNEVYIGYDDFGIFRSDDGAATFKPLDESQDPYDGYDAAKDIEIDPDNGDIYISRYEGLANADANNWALGQVWKSDDKGENWNKISNGLPDGRPSLVMDKNSGSTGRRTLYCATFGNGIYKTTNNGESWSDISTGLGNDRTSIWMLTIDPDNSNKLWAGTNKFGEGGAVYRSTNAGTSWEKVAFPEPYDILDIHIQNGTTYISGTDNWEYNWTGGLYKSVDDGSSWIKIFDNSRVVDIVIDEDNPSKIYAASSAWYLWNENINPGVFVTEDGGNTWSNITGNLGNTFIMFMELDKNQLFVGTNGGGIFKYNLVTSVKEEKEELNNKYHVSNNYPNPFNPSTKINLLITESSKFRISLYNSNGELINEIQNSYLDPGNYNYTLNLEEYPSGIYLIKVTDGKSSIIKKITLLK